MKKNNKKFQVTRTFLLSKGENMAKTRDEIDNQYKWDLTTIYKNLDEWNQDYEYVSSKLEEVASYKNNLMDSASNLYNFLTLDEELTRKIEKMYVFANMQYDAETSNTESQALLGKIRDLNTKYNLSLIHI